MSISGLTQIHSWYVIFIIRSNFLWMYGVVFLEASFLDPYCMMDESSAHHTTVVKQWLNNEFVDWPVEFLSRSPDLTPFFRNLWGRLPIAVYLSLLANKAELQQRIQDGCREITEQELDRVHRSVIRRMQLCIDMDGKHFEQAL
ncbi:hypothetical protein AVEN_197673-1 [Araneus ventricosus]|uniref:Uncharacterized protein n=1 Tax=Araneus ventricosus TaxID=182803 RepID=A0A4Y2U5M2_ARAVE|nr:hypothetical protein AVEN_47869-1 [Araneus ventricosus]GBO06887.1 hypothetical protein AVEN_197673-1 [Araneus ventricosus]